MIYNFIFRFALDTIVNSMKPVYCGISIGPSFVEISLIESTQKINSQRFYLPQEPLAQALKKFFSNLDIKPQKFFIASRYLEKIFDTKLGGSVAQVVTHGFENWPLLRQPVKSSYFKAQPFRQEALASQELIFGLNERIDNKGQVLKSLETEDLEFIASKLKLMEVKRVCVNLLFAAANPVHQNQARDYFKAQGFEVFCADRPQKSNDEIPAWRQNILNACLAGTFSELKEEIEKAIDTAGFDKSQIYFADGNGDYFKDDFNKLTSSLFAWAESLNRYFKKENTLLYLGLESWYLLRPDRKFPHWESPWGMLETSSPWILKLKTQPTLEIENDFFGGIGFGKKELGFEPGPMSFGRSLKPSAFDVLAESFSLNLPQISVGGQTKMKDYLATLVKNRSAVSGLSAKDLMNQLLNQLVSKLMMEITFEAMDSEIVLAGYFAEYLQPILQKKWPHQKWILAGESSLIESTSIVTVGESAVSAGVLE